MTRERRGLLGGRQSDPGRPSGRCGNADRAGRRRPHPLSDPARPGWAQPRLPPRHAAHRAAARPGAGGGAAAAPLRHRLLHAAARAARQCRPDHGPGRRSGAGHHGRGGGGGARDGAGTGLAERVRPRRDRLADRPHRRHGDRRAAGPSSPSGRGHRRREPGQRRDGAGRLQVRGGGRRRGHVLARPRLGQLRPQRRRRDRLRSGGRVCPPPGTAASGQPAGGDHDLDPERLSGVPAGGGARGLRCTGRRDRRHLHGLVHRRAHQCCLPVAGDRRLGGAVLPPERDALRPRRSAAAGHS